MTVCIGVITCNGKKIVAAADRMVSFGAPANMQVEAGVSKVWTVSDKCAVLFSGFVPEGEEIIALTRATVASFVKPGIKNIADAVATAYQAHRTRRAEETIIRPFLGAGFAEFRELVARSAGSQVLNQILGMLGQHNLQTDLMVVGVDDTGAHLFVVGHPGQSFSLDTVGYSAIGSGGTHAFVRLSLSSKAWNKGLSEALFHVYEAKISAEIAQGVGKATDLVIIGDDGVHVINPEDYPALVETHKERPDITPQELAKLNQAFGALR